MYIDRVSDIEDLIRKGAHVIVDSWRCQVLSNSNNAYNSLRFPSINDLKTLVKTAVDSKTTITIRPKFELSRQVV